MRSDPLLRITEVRRFSAAGLSAGELVAPEPGVLAARWCLRLAGWVIESEAPLLHVDVFAHRMVIGRLRVLRVEGEESRGTFDGLLPLLGLDPDFALTLVGTFKDGKMRPLGELRGARVPAPNPPDGAGERSPRPLLVWSLGRSGSTWLTHLLSRHPHLAALRPLTYESRFFEAAAMQLWMMARFEGEARALTGDAGEPTWWGRSRDEGHHLPAQEAELMAAMAEVMMEERLRHARASIRGALDALAGSSPKAHRDWFIEKLTSPRATLLARELWPASRVILLVRDPRDLFCSASAFNASRQKGGFGLAGGEATVAEELERFSGFAFSGARLVGALADRATILRYEDLVLDPMKTLGALLGDLGVDGSDPTIRAMLESARAEGEARQRGHATSRDPRRSISRWQRDLSAPDRELVRDRLRTAAEELGYTP